MPGTASTGSIDTTGLDGQTTTVSAPAMASRTPGPGRAAAAPAKRTRCTATSWWSFTKYSWNPTSSPPTRRSRVRSGSSVTGSRRTPTPNRSASSAVTVPSGAPSDRRWVR